MDRQGKLRLLMTLAAATTLAGCVPGTSPSGGTAGGGLFGTASPVSVERDIEAPAVFNMSGAGLWDGRPSLGGVWVAHVDVDDPERVMIRNTKNGKSVVGALFRRERDNPGPALQVSSDAAEALGLIAGQPTDLSVVALRREETPVPATTEIGPETDDGVIAADAAPAAGAGETVAPEAVAEAEATAAPEPVKRGGLFGFLKKKPGNEPLSAIPEQDATVASSAGAGAIEQTALDPLTASASAAIDRAVAAAPAPAVASVTLKRAYVQIGIFSTEANADRAASQMQSAGMVATVKPDQSNGKTYWRVIVGPAGTETERDSLAAKVKGIGYPDAYPVAN